MSAPSWKYVRDVDQLHKIFDKAPPPPKTKLCLMIHLKKTYILISLSYTARKTSSSGLFWKRLPSPSLSIELSPCMLPCLSASSSLQPAHTHLNQTKHCSTTGDIICKQDCPLLVNRGAAHATSTQILNMVYVYIYIYIRHYLYTTDLIAKSTWQQPLQDRVTKSQHSPCYIGKDKEMISSEAVFQQRKTKRLIFFSKCDVSVRGGLVERRPEGCPPLSRWRGAWFEGEGRRSRPFCGSWHSWWTPWGRAGTLEGRQDGHLRFLTSPHHDTSVLHHCLSVKWLHAQ